MCPRRIVESEEKVTLEETKEKTQRAKEGPSDEQTLPVLLPREQERGYPKSKHRPKIRRKVLSCSKEWESERKPNESKSRRQTAQARTDAIQALGKVAAEETTLTPITILSYSESQPSGEENEQVSGP